VELHPAIPFTSHVTLVSAEPETCAVNACVAPSATLTFCGFTLTVICPWIVTITVAAFDGSATGVAVIVTTLGDGARLGAVNVAVAPLGVIVPQVAPAHPAPETVQLIEVLGSEFAAGVSVAV
jgi:hypothetical protein